MNDPQAIRLIVYLAILFVSGGILLLQAPCRIARPTIILMPLLLASAIASFVASLPSDELVSFFVFRLSIIMPFANMFFCLVFIPMLAEKIEPKDEKPCRRAFYRFIYFADAVAVFIPVFCVGYIPLDIAVWMSIFFQSYCISLQIRRGDVIAKRKSQTKRKD